MDLTLLPARRITVTQDQPVGAHAYHSVLVNSESLNPVAAVEALLDRYAGDFEKAAHGLAASSWILGYYTPSLRMGRLLDASFDPQEELTSQATIAWLEEVPPEWIDPSSTSASLVGGFRLDVACLDVDTAKAVWATLSLMKATRREPSELLSTEWWSIAALRDLLLRAKVE